MLVGEGGGEHRYQARPICDRQIAIMNILGRGLLGDAKYEISRL